MKTRGWFFLSVLLLASCATPYSTEKNFWSFGMGFDVIAVSQDTWHISFVGNDFTDRAIAHKYALRKAAELAQNAGYPYFTLSDEQLHVDNKGSQTTYSERKDKKWDYGYGNTSTTSETTIMVIAKGYHQAPKTDAMVYQSAFILRSVTVE